MRIPLYLYHSEPLSVCPSESFSLCSSESRPTIPCHSEIFSLCRSELFSLCHSERSEESHRRCSIVPTRKSGLAGNAGIAFGSLFHSSPLMGEGRGEGENQVWAKPCPKRQIPHKRGKEEK